MMERDIKREAQIRRWADESIGAYAEFRFLLRLLDGARAHSPPGKITELGVKLNEAYAKIDRLEHEVARMTPKSEAEADVMAVLAGEQCKRVFCYWVPGCPNPKRCAESGRCEGGEG